jgi:hypothetical protein
MNVFVVVIQASAPVLRGCLTKCLITFDYQRASKMLP